MLNFKELHVWKKSVGLVTLIYEVTKCFPTEERFGLKNQMRRSAVSIPSNIAEGHMRSTNKDFGQFLAIARGSCAELETQNEIAKELGYINEVNYEIVLEKIESIAKMLASLHAKVIN